MNSQKLQLYSFFHLNMAFSSIPEERRPDVLKQSYWPLLRLAIEDQIPLGIEASGFTLETINAIDPSWIKALKAQIELGNCEFIGCGYAQIIGPLAPAKVNSENIRIGNAVYEKFLGVKPSIALVNEQAFSAGLVDLYLDAGFKAIIMEWDNAARSYPGWDPTWRYFPQYAVGSSGAKIPVIWNKSIAFQKFQRYAHGEMTLNDQLAYLDRHIGHEIRAFPLYGNDAECFDFRPGRFMTEAPLGNHGEWIRINALYSQIKKDNRFNLVLPSNVLKLIDDSSAGKNLSLQSPSQPIPTKKQDKYNPLRWAVTGRGDLQINTVCWQIFKALGDNTLTTDADWKELCYLWSSDFRTHITETRWREYLSRLNIFRDKWPIKEKTEAGIPQAESKLDQPKISRNGKLVIVEGERLSVTFNCAKGMAIERFTDKSVSSRSLFGTLEHGFYDDIQWGADFFSGHLIYEAPAKSKASDLHQSEPNISWDTPVLKLSTTIESGIGKIKKIWEIIDHTGELRMTSEVTIESPGIGSLRIGHITLNPNCFDKNRLRFCTHNGGMALEKFEIDNKEINHGRSVSFLVSANQCIGLTEGILEFGDDKKCIRVELDKTVSSAVGIIQFSEVREQYFYRASFSLSEMDDTSRERISNNISCSMIITAKNL